MFSYSPYWLVWTRVIKPFGQHPFPDEQIEISLIPLSPQPTNDWHSTVTKIWVQRYSDKSRQGEMLDSLPGKVLGTMIRYLEGPVLHYLLNEDILGHIDWRKYARHAMSGECPLHLCYKDDFIEVVSPHLMLGPNRLAVHTIAHSEREARQYILQQLENHPDMGSLMYKTKEGHFWSADALGNIAQGPKIPMF